MFLVLICWTYDYDELIKFYINQKQTAWKVSSTKAGMYCKKIRVTTSRGNLFVLFIGTERTKMTAPVVVKFEAKNKQQKAASFA